MANRRIHQYTSIARVLDPALPANRSVLLLLPLAAVIGAAVGWHRNGDEIEILRQAATFALIVFVSWALARELDPDDAPAAFISLACGAGVAWAASSPGVLIAFTTLGLMRVVNRSSGLAARRTDSALLVLLTIAVIYLTDSPLFGAVGALAFVLDGTLREPLRHQWIAAFVCIGGTVVYMVDHDVAPGRFAAPDTLFEWLSAAFLLMYGLNILLLRGVSSVGDVGHRGLDLARVRGGMVVGLFAALQGIDEATRVAVIAAAIAGICMGMAFRKGFRSQSTG
jgi:hypothetical protein